MMIRSKFLYVAALLIACQSCMACHRHDPLRTQVARDSATYGMAVSDSIASIIFDARTVVCRLTSCAVEDSLRMDTICKMRSDYATLFRYLLFDGGNFESDKTVYGVFSSWAVVEFRARCGRKVRVEIDFGLNKWRLLDEQGAELCRRDFGDEGREMFRFVQMLFPNDVTLAIHKQNLIQTENGIDL